MPRRSDPPAVPPNPSATPAARTPSTPAASDPYAALDPIPRPDAQEKSTETAWALFQELHQTQERRFAETVPMSAAQALQTLPRPLPAWTAAPVAPAAAMVAQAPATAPAGLTLEDLLLEARRNNRICPQQAGWRALYALLPGKRQGAKGWEPPLPSTGPAWASTGAMSKRLALRDHLQWAVDHGGAARILEFMRQLPEAAWLHVGDEGS